MTTELAERPAPPRVSLVAKMAERFSVEPAKLMGTLKATAFKSSQPVSDEQMMALLIVADQYTLNPFTKEIFAFPDKGGIVPVVSVDGWARIINEHPMFDGVAFTYGGEGAEFGCTATMFRKDRAHPTVITEYMSECKRGGQGPWSTHPRRMLRHKALIQCARVAFGFAGIFDEDEAERIVKGAPKNMGTVDEVPEPASTTAHSVRQLLKADVLDLGDAPEVNPDTLSILAARLAATNDPEIASLILDESRDMSEDDQAALSAMYRAKFQPD